MPRPRLWTFGLTFLPALLLSALLYPVVRPAYAGLARSATNLLLAFVGQPLQIDADADGNWRVWRLEGGSSSEVFGIPPESLTHIYLGLVLLPALLIATPVTWPVRLRLLARGLLLLLAVQVLSHATFVCAWAHYKGTNPSSVVSGWIMLVHSTGGQIFPAALWGFLTWRHWFPADQDAEAAIWDRTPRNAPCPCGSRRKYKHCCLETMTPLRS
jgi:hypothetical protein